MSEKEARRIWVCPSCTLTQRSHEAFVEHMRKHLKVAQVALSQPDRYAKTLPQTEEA